MHKNGIDEEYDAIVLLIIGAWYILSYSEIMNRFPTEGWEFPRERSCKTLELGMIK